MRHLTKLNNIMINVLIKLGRNRRNRHQIIKAIEGKPIANIIVIGKKDILFKIKTKNGFYAFYSHFNVLQFIIFKQNLKVTL